MITMTIWLLLWNPWHLSGWLYTADQKKQDKLQLELMSGKKETQAIVPRRQD